MDPAHPADAGIRGGRLARTGRRRCGRHRPPGPTVTQTLGVRSPSGSAGEGPASCDPPLFPWRRPPPPGCAPAALSGAIVLALGLPLGFALAPRGEGAQISGTSAGSMQQAPSIAQLEEAAARNPRDPVVLVALADAYLGSQRTVDATALY